MNELAVSKPGSTLRDSAPDVKTCRRGLIDRIEPIVTRSAVGYRCKTVWSALCRSSGLEEKPLADPAIAACANGLINRSPRMAKSYFA